MGTRCPGGCQGQLGIKEFDSYSGQSTLLLFLHHDSREVEFKNGWRYVILQKAVLKFFSLKTDNKIVGALPPDGIKAHKAGLWLLLCRLVSKRSQCRSDHEVESRY